MNKFKLIAIVFVVLTGLSFLTFLGYNVYLSANQKNEVKKEVPKFEFNKEVNLSDDGIPLRDDLKASSALRDINELNQVIKDYKSKYPDYLATEKQCFDLSLIEAKAGFPISYTKLENNPKYQELARKYTKIEQDTKVMFLACRFNINDKSNINDNTRLYQEYMNNLQPLTL